MEGLGIRSAAQEDHSDAAVETVKGGGTGREGVGLQDPVWTVQWRDCEMSSRDGEERPGWSAVKEQRPQNLGLTRDSRRE